MKRAAPVMVRQIHPHTTRQPKRINKYLEEIKPLLLILRVFGRFPYIFKDGRVLFKPFSWPVFYTLFIVVLQLFGTFYSIDMLVSLGFSSRSNFEDSLYIICLAASVVQSLAIPFTYWFETSRTLKYIDDWYNFQEEFGSDELDFALTRPMKIVSTIHAPVLIAILLAGNYLFNDFRIIVISPVLTAMGSLSVSLLIFCTTLSELRSASKKMLKRIISSGYRNIGMNRILWLQLSNLTTSFGDTVGYTGLVALVLLFTTFVLVTYGILLLAIDLSFNKSFWVLLCLSLLCIFAQFIVCDAAYRTTDAVGEKFSSELVELNTSALSQNDQREITLYLQTMMKNPPMVHFVGFMNINRSLLVTFISVAVKYLVVIIQFKASSGSCSGANASTEDLKYLTTP